MDTLTELEALEAFLTDLVQDAAEGLVQISAELLALILAVVRGYVERY